jgi:flagellar basal body-associated protein FliL
MAAGVKAPKPKGRPEPTAAAPCAAWLRLLSARLIFAVLALLAVANAAAWYWLHVSRAAEPAADRDQTLALGSFEFNRVNPRDQRLYHGQFDVTIHLFDELDAAQVRDVSRQRGELERTVSAALLRMRAADFTDPRLVRLKDLLQERLNDALDFEAIDNIQIDNLTVERLEHSVPNPIAPQQPVNSSASSN